MGELRTLIEWYWTALDSTPEQAMALYADDIHYTAPMLEYRGKDQMRSIIEDSRRAFPDMKHVILDAVESGESLAIEVQATGTNTGTIGTTGGEIPATGRPVQFTSCDMIKIVGGKIVSWHTYYDRTTLLTQLGLMG